MCLINGVSDNLGYFEETDLRIKVNLEGCGSNVNENWCGGLECKRAIEIMSSDPIQDTFWR